MSLESPVYRTLIISRKRQLQPGSTELAIAYKAYQRGHKVSLQLPENFYIKDGKLYGITRRPKAGTLTDFHTYCEHAISREKTKVEALPLEEFDIIFPRVAYMDPGEKGEFDNMMIYLAVLNMLHPELAIINDPRGVMMAGAKIYETLAFRDFMPETHVTKDPARLQRIMREASEKRVALIGKPIDAWGGSHVIPIPQRGYRTIAEMLVRPLESSTFRPAIVQHEIKGVDRRVLLLNGEIIGAYKRVPSEEGEDRTNLQIGGRVQPYEIQDVDKNLVEAIRDRLVRDGLYFCGLDIMGPEKGGRLENTRIIEINVRSPDSFRSLEVLVDGADQKAQVRDEASAKVVEFAERLSEQRKQAM